MSTGELLVHRAEDLAALTGSWHRRGIRRIRVETSARQGQQLERLSAAINRDLRACGCIEAAVFCLAALVSLPGLGALLWSQLPEHWGGLAALGAGYTLAMALVGKIIGLALAEWRLARNLRSLRTLLEDATDTNPCA